MNIAIQWCFRIGVVCGAVALSGALVAIAADLGARIPEEALRLAEGAFSVFALPFMAFGAVLLAAAIAWLARTWTRLTKATKVVSVFGLLAGTFVGAYFFHWLFPEVLKDSDNEAGKK
jgi:hypothetical protein